MRNNFQIHVLALSILLCLGLTSCAGYDLAANQPGVFGGADKTLKVKGVDYPTIQPWLPHTVRSILRDELAARNMVQWVDSGSADYEIQINVLSLTSREWAATNINTTALYDNAISLEAIVYGGAGNVEVWRSGVIRYSDREEAPVDQFGASKIITQAMRLLADRMRQAF